MPNWCNNRAEFICPSREIYDKLLLSIKNNNWFETFAPLGIDRKIYPNGYDIKRVYEIWNTKWTPNELEINDSDENKCIINVSFDTAWTPPTGVYKLMSTNHNIDVIAYFSEQGCGFFGKCMYSNNENLEVCDYYDYPSDENELEQLREEIGINSDLDNYMHDEWMFLNEMWKEEEN
jgi:hypothetical protein